MVDPCNQLYVLHNRRQNHSIQVKFDVIRTANGADMKHVSVLCFFCRLHLCSVAFLPVDNVTGLEVAVFV